MAATTKATKTAAKTAKTGADAPKTEKPKASTTLKETKARAALAQPSADAITAEALRASAVDDPKMAGIRLHGKEFVGVVTSDKATKTVTVEWERRRLVRKYERYEKRYSRAYAHNPPAIAARIGDTVRIKETRPLSKTKNFVVVEVLKRAAHGAEVQA